MQFWKTREVRYTMYDQDEIAINKMYIDITGDLIAGLLLNQIVHWNLPSKKDGTKRSGEYLVKQRSDWYDEIRISKKQYDRAASILKKMDLVTIQVKKSAHYNGEIALHIKLNTEILMQKINEN